MGPLVLDAEISDQRAWTRQRLSAGDWLVPLPAAAAAELEAAVERLARTPGPPRALDPATLGLTTCAAVMARVRELLLRGTGLAVVDGIPLERPGAEASRTIAWLLGSLLGRLVAQKWDGTDLYDVRDQGKPLEHGVRRSVTNLGQPFHTDGPWLWMPPAFVGLLCVQSAREGGLSRFVSLVTAHNEMRRRHPDLLPRLYRPFPWDRQAEHPPGEAPFATHPVFAFDGQTLVARYYEDYNHKGAALAGQPVDAAGRQALAALREIVDDPAHWVEFRIERGQFQYLNNRQFAHARTAFSDAPGPHRGRHLIRVWNRDEGTPHLEGRSLA
jgi:alpha-ketoglutarate-dependent taurine dioxygenase